MWHRTTRLGKSDCNILLLRTAGTWQANFEGTQFMTPKLVENGHIAGSVSVGDVNVDLNGDIIRAEAPENESPIVR